MGYTHHMDLNKITSKIIKYSFYSLFILVPLILTPYNYELFEFNKMLTVYFFTLTIASSWIIKCIYQQKFIFKSTPFDIPLFLFFFSQLISTILSIDPQTSIWGYYSRFHGGLLSTISYLVLYFAFTTHLTDAKHLKTSLKIILITALVVSIYGILERLGIDKHIWVQDVQNRVFSTLGQPNWLAAYLICLLPITFSLILKHKNPLSLAYSLSLSFIFFITLLFTRSRSGILGFGLSLFIFLILTIIKNGLKKLPFKKLVLVFTTIGLTALVVGTSFTPSLSQLIKKTYTPQVSVGLAVDTPAVASGGSKSSDIRKVVWTGALNIWRNFPIFGSGVETFAYSYYNFRLPEHNLLSEWDFLYNKAHNEFLNFLTTTGTFGLFTYCLIILWFGFFVLKHLKKDKSYLLIGLLSGYSGLAVSNFFGFSVVPVGLFFFLFPAFTVTLTQSKPVSSKTAKTYYHQIDNRQAIFISLTLIITTYLIFGIINLWRADRQFTLGRNLVKANQIQTGFQHLEKATNITPNQPLFRTELAESQAKLAYLYHQEVSNATQAGSLRDQLIKSAIANSDQVIGKNPVHLNFYKSRIKIFLLLALIDPQYQQPALDATLKALSLSPTDAKLYYNLSLIYSQIGQTGLAEQTLLDTIKLKSNYEAARFQLGSLYQQTNRPDLAREQYEYILTNLNPQSQTVKDALEELN